MRFLIEYKIWLPIEGAILSFGGALLDSCSRQPGLVLLIKYVNLPPHKGGGDRKRWEAPPEFFPRQLELENLCTFLLKDIHLAPHKRGRS